MRFLACLTAASLWLAALPLAAQQVPELRWAGDAEGGAPFVEVDPNDPSRVVGFEVEVAQLLAAGLGRVPRFVQVGFTSLDASAARGDFDVGLSGIEDSAVRRSRLAVTIPYYEFREVLTVRQADGGRYRRLADLAGRRVATLGATLAYDLLVAAQSDYGVIPVTYEDDVHPYSDLALGRVDAVLLDEVLATRALTRNAGLINAPSPVATGRYVGILAPGNTQLRDRMNEILRDAMRDGRLEAIFTRWNMWNEDQPRLYARLITDQASSDAVPAQSVTVNAWDALWQYLPALLNAAVITLLLSALSMVLAITLGALIATGRVYGPRPLQVLLTAWVEVVRGTPLLLQLFVLYFGLTAVVQLPAFLAALIGLGVNYAAYESEIY